MAEPAPTFEGSPRPDPVLANTIRRYETRLASDPDSLAFAPLADLYRKSGRTREAIALCRDGLTRYPEYVTARLILAKALLADGRLEEAKAEFLALLEAAPDHAQAHQSLAEIYRRLGDLDGALGHLRQLVTLDPGNKEARALLDALEPKEDGEETPLRRLLDDGSFVTKTFGKICVNQGCLDEAVFIFARLLKRDPRDIEAREQLEEALRLKAQRRR